MKPDRSGRGRLVRLLPLIVSVVFWAGCSWPDQDHLARLVAAIERLRDSPDPADRKSYDVMQGGTADRLVREYMRDTRPDDPVAMITCVRDRNLKDDDAGEDTEPQLPDVDLRTRVTAREVAECMHKRGAAGLDAASVYDLMRMCVADALWGPEQQWEYQLRLAGAPDPVCGIVYMAPFRKGGGAVFRKLFEPGPEAIALQLIASDAPPAGVNLRSLLGRRLLVALCAQGDSWGCPDHPAYPRDPEPSPGSEKP